MANDTSRLEFLPTQDLCFDWKNPRLSEYQVIASTPDEEILTILWEAMDVLEIVQSIEASGFFQHEPLIVAKENSKYIVIEGNRRLAAVKVLLNPGYAKEQGWNVPTLSMVEKNHLLNLPVIVINRKDSWRYLGFKHVNGPAKWTGYAKAKYIADIHENYGISLQEIARQIGDRHKTVQRLFRSLMVLRQAEKAKIYNIEDRYNPRFAFSHLYTGLDYEGISSFLGIESKNDEDKTPVPDKKIQELGELCVWMYGSKKAKKPPVIVSQNPHLRHLDIILKSREGLSALRDGLDISTAYEISRPSRAVFEEALLASKRGLTTARAHLTTGYDASEDLLGIVLSIAEIADDIYNEMERKRNSRKKRRITIKRRTTED
jgi:hypothetical protein